MDGTLYSHDEYIRSQHDLPVMRLASLQGKTFDQMNGEISERRKGQSISLGNIFLSFGISIEETIRWREELYRPEDYLREDNLLCVSLQKLAKRFSFALVTNNPVSLAVRTLKILGVYDFFPDIVGLDTCGVSKPHAAIFNKVLQLYGVSAKQCISVGDRYDIDIALALDLGMGGILVDGVEDVYKLPETLHDNI